MRRAASPSTISPRVAQALDYLCRGYSRTQTARAMGCSESTIKNFWAAGYRQLGCHNNVSAALVWSQLRYPEAFGLLCARCAAPCAGEDRLLAGGWFE